MVHRWIFTMYNNSQAYKCIGILVAQFVSTFLFVYMVYMI